MILNFTEDSSSSPSGGNNDDQLTNQAQGPYDGSLSFVSFFYLFFVLKPFSSSNKIFQIHGENYQLTAKITTKALVYSILFKSYLLQKEG